MDIFLDPSTHCICVERSVVSSMHRNISSTSLKQPAAAMRPSLLRELSKRMVSSGDHFARSINTANVSPTVFLAFGALLLRSDDSPRHECGAFRRDLVKSGYRYIS